MKKEILPKYTIKELKDMGRVVLEYNTGSHMYGTNVPGSDRDYKGVFILPEKDYGDFNFTPEWEEIKDTKTVVNGGEVEGTYYNIRKFMQLLLKSNPNTLEVFDIPKDCLVHKHPCMDLLIARPDLFVTKACMEAFSGYAMEQVNKATGQNKKQNWDEKKMARKTVLDFCFVPHDQGSMPVKKWLERTRVGQKDCGLSRIDHMPNMFGLYVLADNGVVRFTDAKPQGIVRDEDTSNSLCLSEIPRNVDPSTVLSFNEAAYSKHCADYKSYLTWKAERNDLRWVDVKSHGQKIDGKNMLHMQRLMNMAIDIATDRGIITRRPEGAELIKIRRGEVSLQELLDSAKAKLSDIRKMFEASKLPDEVDPVEAAKMMDIIKKEFYKK